ncbi:cytochrome P450 [Deinococcus yavapaiensis]|uniref:Cytochrome P450 n=1 Tax=Deinococcus yavapaiensis KR-236 TaxID=694435 RepID=A0A318SAD0_9DEIO|nr:cytochrome P450 [Deinococcus yavapaiensis]PYE53488.1 cytochrome P450 [Deinococcus yavapaiensis KR-236]
MTTSDRTASPPRCPVHDDTASFTRRTASDAPREGAVERDEHGLYRVRSLSAAREVLRSEDARQAGFMAEVAGGVKQLHNLPVLFEEGEKHHEMRRSTARYFTPTHVATYQPMIAALADDLVGELARVGEANLDDLSLKLAVNVAARVVGLTSSRLPGLERRVIAFVESGANSEPGAASGATSRMEAWRQQANMALFYLLDVKPAIQARRTRRRDDLISHLLDRGYNDVEIMTECLTYGTAGMVTTREFISVAAWHLLRDAALRAEYVHGTEPQRHAVLHEILRLEPVVTTLYRRAERPIVLNDLTIPEGSVLALDVQEANTDPAAFGEDAQQICPGRALPRGVQAPALSFGDGHHRCPGAFLAIRESDVFLRRLLLWQDLEIVSEPRLRFNEVVKGYELRGFRVRLGRSKART